MEKLIEKALTFAKEKHKFQKRKGTNLPYFVHIEAVYNLLQKSGADIDTIIVGILHDTLEDTDTSINELVDNFGVEIAYMVDTLSERKSISYKERKHMQNLRIKNSTHKIKLVKCADCVANLSDSIKEMSEEQNFWSKFNAPKEDIKTHYSETIEALNELEGVPLYSQLKDCYNKVFISQNIQNTENKILKSQHSTVTQATDYFKHKYCTDCYHMEREITPDPYDWFCDDDERYICGITKKTLSECNRPYEKQPTPPDCPLLSR